MKTFNEYKQEGEPVKEKSFHQLSQQEKVTRTLEMESMPRSYYEVLEQNGFMTGSKVYGDPNRASDEDWVVNIPPYVFEGFAIGTDSQEYWEDDGMQVLYAHKEGTILNIICVSDVEMFDAWYQATLVMQSLKMQTYQTNRYSDNVGYIFHSMFNNNKYARVRIFRALKDVLYDVSKWADKPMLPKEEALKFYKCRVCRQEANNFSCKAERLKWMTSGICERCSNI